MVRRLLRIPLLLVGVGSILAMDGADSDSGDSDSGGSDSGGSESGGSDASASGEDSSFLSASGDSGSDSGSSGRRRRRRDAMLVRPEGTPDPTAFSPDDYRDIPLR